MLGAVLSGIAAAVMVLTGIAMVCVIAVCALIIFGKR